MSELWPSRKKAKETNLVDDLMDKIEALFNEGQVKELRILVRDLGDLALAVRELITQMEAKKLYGYGVKTQTVGEAMAEIRKRIGSGSKRPPQGREVLASIARRILET